MFWHVSFRFDLVSLRIVWFALVWFGMFCSALVSLGMVWFTLVCFGMFGQMFSFNFLACLAMLRYVLACFVPLWYPWEWFGLLWYVLACFVPLWYPWEWFGLVWYVMFRFIVLACLAMLWYVLACFVPFRYPWEWFGLLWYVWACLGRCSGYMFWHVLLCLGMFWPVSFPFGILRKVQVALNPQQLTVFHRYALEPKFGSSTVCHPCAVVMHISHVTIQVAQLVVRLPN